MKKFKKFSQKTSKTCRNVAFLSFFLSFFLIIPAQSQIKVTTDGNVGIGTTIPSYKLDVKTTGYNMLRLDCGSQNDLKSTEEVIFESEPTLDETNEARLDANVPNPFTVEATISYYLPSDIQEAMLNIYNMQGKQLKSFTLEATGEGSIVVQGNELYPGLFKYALIADGQIIGIETMVLTE